MINVPAGCWTEDRCYAKGSHCLPDVPEAAIELVEVLHQYIPETGETHVTEVWLCTGTGYVRHPNNPDAIWADGAAYILYAADELYESEYSYVDDSGIAWLDAAHTQPACTIRDSEVSLEAFLRVDYY
jgi:hypothetical protein